MRASENIGRPFAAVLDELAVLLHAGRRTRVIAGALPAKLTVVEERVLPRSTAVR